MATDDMEIVSAIRAYLVENVGKKRYELWFGDRTQLSIVGGVLIVDAASSFYQNWLRTHFRVELEAAGLAVLGQKLEVQFRINEALAQPAPAPSAKTVSEPATVPFTPSEPGQEADGSRTNRPGAAAGRPTAREANENRGRSKARESSRPKRRRKFAELSSFVVGMNNKLALTSAELAAEQPGRVSPLAIHGRTGVGKTFLLEGICATSRRLHPGIHSIYMTAERFTTCFLEALNGRGLPLFRQKYRGVDLLLIDDIQFFEGKRATLVEFQYTIDALLSEGRQIVVASDRPPADLKGLGPELVARLVGGLICRIDPPDYATRLAIVRQQCQRMELTVTEEVKTLIASQLTSNARELCGALNRLKLISVTQTEPISRTLAEHALADLKEQYCTPVKLSDIQRAVCDTFGIPPESLKSNRKATSVSHPRMLAMWLARKHTRAALSEIGHFFGRRSHSTVISAQKKVDGWMSEQKKLTVSEKTYGIDEAIRRVEETLRIA